MTGRKGSTATAGRMWLQWRPQRESGHRHPVHIPLISFVRRAMCTLCAPEVVERTLLRTTLQVRMQRQGVRQPRVEGGVLYKHQTRESTVAHPLLCESVLHDSMQLVQRQAAPQADWIEGIEDQELHLEVRQ